MLRPLLCGQTTAAEWGCHDKLDLPVEPGPYGIHVGTALGGQIRLDRATVAYAADELTVTQ